MSEEEERVSRRRRAEPNVQRLTGEFPMFRVADIKRILRLKGNYEQAHGALSGALVNHPYGSSSTKRKQTAPDASCHVRFEDSSVTIPILKRPRTASRRPTKTSAKRVRSREGKVQCGCCFGQSKFEKMAQCSDGHLFCTECLVGYVQEAAFGSGRSELSCMAAGCTCSYPASELERILPEKVLRKYNQRQAEEAVAAACADDELARCPSCDFPALLDGDVLRFSCPNPDCLKESCRKCGVQWNQHAGKTCEQLETADETRARVRFEERLNEARVRTCPKCRVDLLKENGCNHIACRCGGHMCYVCRSPMDPLARTPHFCRCGLSDHLSSTVCPHCRKCRLHSDPTPDDDRTFQEIQREAEAERDRHSPPHTVSDVFYGMYRKLENEFASTHQMIFNRAGFSQPYF